mmetsp:Transcript_7833/g.22977  ORF Transcript_7833/g.22977 Transcript_7833/m.22977 type:complete len:223 (+) Transcript_7833:1191-1859(+)
MVVPTCMSLRACCCCVARGVLINAHTFAGVWKAYLRPSTKGCARQLSSASTFRSAMVCCRSFGSPRAKTASFLRTFIAKISLVCVRRTCITLPYVPRPITLSSSKSPSVTSGSLSCATLRASRGSSSVSCAATSGGRSCGPSKRIAALRRMAPIHASRDAASGAQMMKILREAGVSWKACWRPPASAAGSTSTSQSGSVTLPLSSSCPGCPLCRPSEDSEDL